MPNADFFHILREFPDLKIVRITFYGNDRGIDELAKLQHLNELEISGLRSPAAGPQNLAWIGRLTHLRALKVGCPGDRLTGFATLAGLQHLELIAFDWGCPDTTLEQLAVLPHLKDLAIYGGSTGVALPTRAGFAALAQAPALKTVTLFGWPAGLGNELRSVAQAALPACSVSELAPWGKPSSQQMPSTWLSTVFLAIGLGLHLSAQFRGPSSRLIPHFVVNHAVVAIGFMAVLIGLTTRQFMSTGFPSMFADRDVNRRRDSDDGHDDRGPPDVVRSTARPAPPARSAANVARHHHLHAHSPFDDRGTASTGVQGSRLALDAADGGSRSRFLRTGVVVAGQSVRRNRTSRKDATRPKPLANWSTQWRPNSLTNLTRRDSQLERSLDGPWDPTWWHRIERWRLGNPPGSWISMMLMLFTFVCIIVMVKFTQRLTALPNQFPFAPLRGVVMFGIAQPLVIGGWMLAARWRVRTKLLALEAMRPVGIARFGVRWPR